MARIAGAPSEPAVKDPKQERLSGLTPWGELWQRFQAKESNPQPHQKANIYFNLFFFKYYLQEKDSRIITMHFCGI